MGKIGSKSFGQPVSQVNSRVENLEARRLFCSTHAAEHVAALAPTSKVITDALYESVKPGPVVDHKGSWYKPARKVTIHTGRSLTTGRSVPVKTTTGRPAQSAAVGRAADSVSFSTNASGLPLLTSRADGKGLKVFLDFDGYNSDIPFDLDGNGANFNTNEQTVIYNAWRDIVSYFSMLDVNVTTIQPPTGGSNPNFVWQRITDSVSGGAAYVGAINNSSSNGWTEDSMAVDRTSGIAHEIGHQLSLSHQADWNDDNTKLNEYSSGYTAHGPIIGVDFAQQVHKWWFGRSSDRADDLQDDLKDMASYLKQNYPASVDGYMPDDFTATSIANATNLTLSGNNYLVTGAIERNSDADFFSFSSSGSPFALHVEPTFFSPLAPKLELYNAAGQLIAAKDDTSLRNAADNTGLSFTANLPAGTYYARVSGHGDYSDQGEYAFFATPLPAGWAESDVAPGTTGRGGSAGVNNGTFTVAGSGSDIGGQADELHFVYQLLSGDSSITARVTGFDAADPFAKAGVMIRETLAAGARNASLYLTPTRYEYANRTTFNGGTNYTLPSLGANSWLRLSRSGNVITYAASSDGVNFNNLGSVTMSGLASPVYVGLAVTSKSRQRQATGTFANVVTTGTTPTTTYSSVAAPTNVTATPAAGQTTNVQLSWNAVTDATGYVIERSNDGVTWSVINSVGTGTTSLTSPLAFGSMRWWYRVSSNSAAGAGAPSAAVSVVNKPGAPTNPQAVRMDGTRLSLTWRDGSGETGYRVERSTDGGVNYTTLTTVAANIRGYNATGLTSGTAYTFRITPTSAAGDGVPLIINTATPLPAVANLRFTNKAASQMAIAWDDQANEAGFRVERSTDGTNWTTLTTTAANVTSYVDSTVTPVTEYYYRVAGVLNGVAGVASTILAASPAAVALPAGWTSGDLGGVGGSGATGHSNGTWTVIGSGDDIWNSADELHFASRTLSGNGEIVARMTSQENTDGWAKAGVMIRENLTANSRQVMMTLTPENGSQFGYRTATGGGSDWTGYDSGTRLKAPYWLKLVRQGDVITGYVSADGSNWTSRGSVTLSGLASTVNIGLANCSSRDDLLSTTKFDNVTVTQAVPQPKVNLVLLENGATQRSMIRTASIRFDQQVTLAENAISLTRNGVSVPFTLSPGSGSSLIFSLNFGTGGLGDGSYTLTVNASAVTGAGGKMAANHVYTFYRLYGDIDADRKVTFNDFLAMQNAFGSTIGSPNFVSGFDYDDNGAIDFNDFLPLQNNFGKTI